MKTARRTARIARFYHDAELHPEQELTLSKQASHHLITVLRTRKDDLVELFNGDGYNYIARVVDTGQRNAGKCALLQLGVRQSANTNSKLQVTLVQAISRGDKMDTTLRQSVELGVTHIQPLYCRQSAKPLDDKRTLKKIEHWQNIIVSACEQSGRTMLPSLAPPAHLNQWLKSEQPDAIHSDLIYMLAPTATLTLTEHLLAQTPSPEAVTLMIGPESGFDPDEIDQAKQTGVSAVRFGPRILRTETAGPACIAVMQALSGDLGNAI